MTRSAAFLTWVLAGWIVCSTAEAGTTGRLSGRVLDAKKQPLARLNVAVPAARTGAVTQENGRFVILNLPSGTYDVRASLIGYQPVMTQGVVISADNTTSLEITLREAPVEMQEVVVTAERPVVNVNLTSSLAAVTREEMNSLPVQELADIVNLQAGVVDGHFRGGRLGEVQYQVDGVTVNNPFDNKSTLRLDRSLLEEVQVVSGTFDAEYGQAMSGVVNAVLRSGGDRYEWDAEAFAGGFWYADPAERLVDQRFGPADVQNYQLTASGPARLLPKTTFLATARHYRFDDYVRGERRFLPTDKSDFENKVFVPTGDGESVPLGYSREWSGVGKLTNHSFGNIVLGYQAILNLVDGRRINYAYRYNPEGLSKQKTFSLTHGLDFTHTLDKTSFYDLSVRHNYFQYSDMVYENLFDVRYDLAGAPPPADPVYEEGALLQGVDFNRFEQSTSALVVKGTYQNQVTPDHHVKLGAEYQFAAVRFGHPGHLVYTQAPGQAGQVVFRYVDDPAKGYLPVREYRPVSTSAFAQDEIEWNDLRLRAGLRFDFFDARAFVPSDLANPANAIRGQPLSVPVATSNKISISPRLGVSFPVTRDAALFFAYGHFYQMSALGQAFDNAYYRLLSELQTSETNNLPPTMGNPDIKPERTVQYQFGYKQALSAWLGLDVSAFYKDIRDLLGVEVITTYNGARYARFTNVDFGNVIGFTVALDQRQLGWVRSTMDYTWQFAQGNSSDPNETANRAEAGEDARPRLVPLNWDQRHTLNLTVHVGWPGALSTSAVLRAASGQPYTPALSTGAGSSLEANSGRKPAGVLLDLRAERPLKLGGLDASLFGRAFNVFDARFFNSGFVFNTSGSPYYSRYPAADIVTLNDPTRFYQPRRIEIGLSLHGGPRP